MNRSLLIAPALALIAACETNAPAPLARETFGLTRATSICSGAGSRCAALGVIGIDDTACIAKASVGYQTWLDEDLAQPNATYDPIAAARCARTSRVRLTEDDTYSDSDLLQCLFMVGGLGNYEWLNFHSACQSDAGCAPGYFCYHGIDGTQAPIGWCKLIGAHSEAGMECNATRSDNGSRVTYGWSDTAACYESDGLFCGGGDENRHCIARVELGAPCSYEMLCVYGAVCRPACNGSGCGGETCQLPGKSGEVCSSRSACADRLRCTAVAGASGTCQPRLQDGAACAEDEDCASSFCSDELGVCASALRADCEALVRLVAE